MTMREFTAKLPLRHDASALRVWVGDVEHSAPMLHRVRESDFYWKADVSGIPVASIAEMGMKEGHAYFCGLLGPKFARRFHAAQYHTWISPHFSTETANMLRHRGKHWQKYDSKLVERSHLVRAEIQQAERDGLPHLIPTIVYFARSVSEIRATIGRGAWRRAANISRTRAAEIMKLAYGDGPEAFLDLLEVRPSILRHMGGTGAPDFVAARLSPRTDAASYRRTLHIVRDTMFMAGDEFNKSWSLARVQREHDERVKARARRQYSDKRFADDWSHERDGFKAIRLVSKAEIAAEGSAQHHCVAAYGSRAAQGNYAVFRVEGKERGTLGLAKSKDGRWRVDQLYAACNERMSPAASAFAMGLAGILNGDGARL